MTGRNEGTERELGMSDKTRLGVGREEKCNILFFRLPTKNELLLFSYLGFSSVFLKGSENKVAERLARNHFPLHTLVSPPPRDWLLVHTFASHVCTFSHVPSPIAACERRIVNHWRNHAFAISDSHTFFSLPFGYCERWGNLFCRLFACFLSLGCRILNVLGMAS